ncbi:ATP-binding cassette domain-containing protein [Oscillospiraceae bacterium WX1]
MVLDICDISKSFGDKAVLQNISLRAESGQALGLLGRNGAGKTTLIRIIMGVFNADSGDVLLDGKMIDRKSIRLGYLPEERGLYPKKRIRDQLLYFAALKGMAASDARHSVDMLLDRVALSEAADKKLETLSKGNQQKIQLAAALINDPDILVLDEPFSGLDPVNAMLLKDIVLEMIGRGKLVFFSSHQMNYIEEFCRDIAILNGGKIVLSGPLKDIRRSYDRLRLILKSPDAAAVARFLDAAAKDLVTNIETQEDTAVVTLRAADQKMALLKRLSEQQLNLDSFTVFEPSLSDIFVEYTEDAI